jgi:hypothetical protein
MKVVIGLLFIGLLSASIAASPDAPGGPIAPLPSNGEPPLPGQAEFERDLKTANEARERAKLKFDEATERARLNYIKVLEDNLSDLGGQVDPRTEKYQKELVRVRSLKFHSPKFEYTKFRWENNGPPVKMIHKDEGFCYISDLGGALDGGGENVRVYISDDGYWYLHGTTAHGFLVAEAMAVKIVR